MTEPRALGRPGVLLCLAVFCTAVMLMASARSASAVSLGAVWSDDTDSMEVVGRSGASLLRVEFTPAKYGTGSDWTRYDAVFGGAAKNGMTVLPLIKGRLNNSGGLPTYGEKPEYSEWLKRLVRRYGYNGGYWSSHPEIPAHPVIGWELWNEPNNSNFGTIYPNAYGTFLSWAGPAIQSASESWSGQKTGVLFAGLLAADRTTGYQNYLETAYQVAGPGSFTGVGFHPYELDPSKFPEGETRYEAFRRAVVGLRKFLGDEKKMPGASGKSIWVTELGWPTEGAENGVEESEQATLLSESFNWAKGKEAAEKDLKAIVWYTVKDIPEAGWQYRCGLRRVNGTYRSSWFAFQEATGAPRWPNPGPKLKVAYADAADANSTSVWQAGPESGWQQAFLWGHEIAAGSSPAALTINGTPNVFYVDAGNNNTITDWTWNSTTGWQQTSFYGHTVAKGTSPVAIMNNGVPTVFFVDATYGNTISEWTWNSTTGWQQTFFYGHTVAAGTSPSAVAINGAIHVFFNDASYGNTITDWTFTPTTGWQQVFFYGHTVAAGTSPAALNLEGTVRAFFVDATNANTITEWSSPGGWHQVYFWGHPVVAGSSPAALMNGTTPYVFFPDASYNNTVSAWTWNSTEGWHQNFLWGHPVVAGTTPDAVIDGGTPNVYFVDAADNNTITDWTWNPTTGWQQAPLWGHPLSSGSSPSAFE